MPAVPRKFDRWGAAGLCLRQWPCLGRSWWTLHHEQMAASTVGMGLFTHHTDLAAWIRKILSRHFWFTNFRVPDPPIPLHILPCPPACQKIRQPSSKLLIRAAETKNRALLKIVFHEAQCACLSVVHTSVRLWSPGQQPLHAGTRTSRNYACRPCTGYMQGTSQATA